MPHPYNDLPKKIKPIATACRRIRTADGIIVLGMPPRKPDRDRWFAANQPADSREIEGSDGPRLSLSEGFAR